MVVDANRRLLINYKQPRSGIDDTRAAVRAQLFTTGPLSIGYAIGHILIDRGFDTDEFLGDVALYTTDAEGDPDRGMSGNGVKNYSKRARWSRNR